LERFSFHDRDQKTFAFLHSTCSLVQSPTARFNRVGEIPVFSNLFYGEEAGCCFVFSARRTAVFNKKKVLANRFAGLGKISGCFFPFPEFLFLGSVFHPPLALFSWSPKEVFSSPPDSLLNWFLCVPHEFFFSPFSSFFFFFFFLLF